MSNGGLYDARGKRAASHGNPQAINFQDQGWIVRIQDKETLLAIHPAHAPVILTNRGEVMQLEPEHDKGMATAYLMVPQFPEADPTAQLAQELANEFIEWCSRRSARIQEVTGGEDAGETPVTTQPAGEAS